MKKFLILTLVLILSYVVKSQPGYTNISARYNWLAGVFRALHLPSGCGAPGFTAGQWHGDGAVYIDTCARKFYYYADGWIPLLDSSSINIGHVDSVYSTIDSLVVVKYTNGTRDTLNIAGGGTAANYYPVSFSFNTGTGVLTLNRNILSPITVSLNGRYLPFTDTASMLTPYLRKIDTSNKWVNKNLIHNDSIFYRIGVDTFGLKLPPPAPSGGYGIVSGGVITWLHDLVYNVSAATYWINGVLYSSPSTDVTLDPADGTFNRVDEIVGTTSGTVIVITGTPANPALEPDIDESTQFKFGFEIVFAATTEPPAVSQEWVYQEAIEWTPTSSSGNIVVNSTNNPFAGTKDIEATNAVNLNNVALVRSSALAISLYNTFSFQIRSKGNWGSNKKLLFRFYDASGGLLGSFVFGSGSYGFVSTNTSSYQTISVPLSDFISSSASVKQVGIICQLSSGNFGWYIDNIQFQGASTPTPISQNFVTDIFRIQGIDSIYFKIAGVTYAIKDSTGAPVSTPTLQQIFNTEVGGSVLTKRDTISAGANRLMLIGSGATLFYSQNTSTSGSAAVVQGVRTDGAILFVNNNGTGAGYALSVNKSGGGFGMDIAQDQPQTDSIQTAIKFITSSSAGAGANGIGVGLDFYHETTTSGTNGAFAGSIQNYWKTATHASRESVYKILGVNNTATETFLEIQHRYIRANNLADTVAYLSDIRAAGSTPTLQQVFNTEVGGSMLNKDDTLDLQGVNRAIFSASGLDIRDYSDANKRTSVGAGYFNFRNSTSNAQVYLLATGVTGSDHSFEFGNNGNGSGTDTVATLADVRTANGSSGTYTPTVTNSTNTDTAVVASDAQWLRVGNTVTVSGRFTADPTSAGGVSFEMSLPVASAMTAAPDVAGVAFCGNISGQGGEIIAEFTNDTALVLWTAGNTTNQLWSYTYTYQIR